jgi:hypothetical protein
MRRVDARPGNRKAVCPESELLHQLHVTSPAVIVIVSRIASVAVPGHAGRVREPIPDGLATPILVDRPPI